MLLLIVNLQNVAKFQKFQLDNLVDFEKCCKTRIYLQKSGPKQPRTSEILPKFQIWPKFLFVVIAVAVTDCPRVPPPHAQQASFAVIPPQNWNDSALHGAEPFTGQLSG